MTRDKIIFIAPLLALLTGCNSVSSRYADLDKTEWGYKKLPYDEVEISPIKYPKACLRWPPRR